jgi:hypothetical protein
MEGGMSDDPTPDWFLREAAHRALLESLRDTPPFVPGPDPVVEALREAEALRNAGRLN